MATEPHVPATSWRRWLPGFSPALHADLLACIALAPLVPALSSTPLAPLRIILGLILALVAPGYVLLAALLPGRTELDDVTRLGLSAAVSAGVLPILILILDALHGGFGTTTLLLALAVWIAGWATVAILRRSVRHSGAEPRERTYHPALQHSWRGLSTTHRLVTAGLGIVVTVCGLTWLILLPLRTSPTTEFSMLGAGGEAVAYPWIAGQGEEIAVALQVVSHEEVARTYHVEVWVTQRAAGERVLVRRDRPFVLGPGQQHSWRLDWRMPALQERQPVDLLLYADGVTDPYRRLRLLMDVR